MSHHGPGGDERSLTDLNPLNHNRTGPNMTTFADNNIPTERHAGREVTVISNDAVVVDRDSGVDNRVHTDNGTCLYDGSGHKLRSAADLSSGRNDRRGVANAGEAVAEPSKPLVHCLTCMWQTDRSHRVDQFDGFHGHLKDTTGGSHLATIKHLTEQRSIVVRQPRLDSPVRQLKRFDQHGMMVTRPEYDHRRLILKHHIDPIGTI